MINSDLVYEVSYEPVFQGNKIVKRFSWTKTEEFFKTFFIISSVISILLGFSTLYVALSYNFNHPYLVAFSAILLTSLGFMFISGFPCSVMHRIEKREKENLREFFAQYKTVIGRLSVFYVFFDNTRIVVEILDRKESFTHSFDKNIETTFTLDEDGVYVVSFRKDDERIVIPVLTNFDTDFVDNGENIDVNQQHVSIQKGQDVDVPIFDADGRKIVAVLRNCERVDVPEIKRVQNVDVVGLMSQFGDDEAIKLVETIVDRCNVLRVAQLSEESQREVTQVADDVADIVLAWQRIWVLDNNVDTKKLVNILSDLLTELTLVTRFEVSSVEDTIVAHGRVIAERVKKFEKENFENKTEGL